METTDNSTNPKPEATPYAEVVETSKPAASAKKAANVSILQQDKSTGNIKIAALTPEQREMYLQKAQGLATNDPAAILNYGIEVQKNLSASSTAFLQNVKAFDAGEIGGTITDLLGKMEQIDIDPSKVSPLRRMLMRIPGFRGLALSVKKIMNQFDDVSGNIDTIIRKLDQGRLSITDDNVKLAKLFDDNVKQVHALDELLIIGHLSKEEHEAELNEMVANADQYEDYQIAEKRDFVTRLDRRLHDMATTRFITLQSLPQIKLVMNNNTMMAEKIQQTVLTTMPIWKQSVAIAVALIRQNKMVLIQQYVNDSTNKMLVNNSELLKTNSTAIARENERGIVEIETLRTVHTNLVTTLNDIKQIKAEGEQARKNADKELQQLEADMEKTVLQIESIKTTK